MSSVSAEHPTTDAVHAPTGHVRPDALLADFVGPRARSYLAHHRRTECPESRATAQAQDRAKPDRALSWHWPAFLLTIPWLFYRKMYLGGIVLVVLPVLFDHIAPGSLFFGSGLMIAFCTGLYAKSWYLTHALGKIDAATKRFPAMDRRLAYIRHAGGVSVPGAVFGALTQGITVSLAVHDLLRP